MTESYTIRYESGLVSTSVTLSADSFSEAVRTYMRGGFLFLERDCVAVRESVVIADKSPQLRVERLDSRPGPSQVERFYLLKCMEDEA